MKFGTIITACKGLSRLSGKVLIQLLGMEVLCLIIKRLKRFKYCNHFVLATTKPNFYHELDYEV
jgi:spore coat polysaccharide biosynthesis protein SpsF (cytidylyltransferase family)